MNKVTGYLTVENPNESIIIDPFFFSVKYKLSKSLRLLPTTKNVSVELYCPIFCR